MPLKLTILKFFLALLVLYFTKHDEIDSYMKQSKISTAPSLKENSSSLTSYCVWW